MATAQEELIDAIPGNELLLRFLMKWLVDEGLYLNTMTDKDGRTALHWAAESGDATVAQLLIDSGASLTATSKEGFTPLHEAASKGSEEMAKLLIDTGKSINASGQDYEKALHLAAQNGKIEMAQLLIDKGASVNATDEDDGWTPLHVAAENGTTAMVQLLIDKGASINATDEYGFTPLHKAASGSKDIVKLLIDHGASVNVTDEDGWAPLHVAAAIRGKGELVQLLIDKGALINATTEDGATPLSLAASGDRTGSASLLLRVMAARGAVPANKMNHVPWSSGHNELQRYLEHSPNNRASTDEMGDKTMGGERGGQLLRGTGCLRAVVARIRHQMHAHHVAAKKRSWEVRY